MTRSFHCAFTLIELLVVITIVVVLLALLAPAMDKAVYEAELAVCAAKLDGIGATLGVYAFDHKRYYPFLQNRLANDGNEPHHLSYPGTNNIENAWDLRPLVEPYMRVNIMYNCPLAAEVKFESFPSNANLYSTYSLWFGYGYRGEKQLKKLGDRWSWGGRMFDLLISDYDFRIATATYSLGSHPDREGKMRRLPPGNWSGWEGFTSDRGLLDINSAHSDGAVRRLSGVAYKDDPRVVRVPHGLASTDTTITFYQVPQP